ncbi:MAG: response regulator [Parvibaculum sp.]|uniref:ATP-binding protein n=1 Tax=Parvibaculum sp. TaxID=2024848 RepID=UPI0025D54491|nr:ATP-binding protein [Parvibaculum sp.]MCE9648716.1 response regulator [Parvibaculum sp.]
MIKNFAPERTELDFLVQAVVDYAIYMLDPRGYVKSWNAGAERIKGYPANEIIGQHFSKFYTPEDVAAGKPDRALHTALTTGRFEDEGWRVRKDGTRLWAMVVVDVIYNDNGELIGFAKITRDMTERRIAQERLEAAQIQSVQSQKLEALGQLTGGMAHDFNNLLAAIIGGTDLALRNVGDQERQMKLLTGIRDTAQRGAALIKQLLAFARKQPLESKLVDTKAQVEIAAELLRHSLTPNIELIVEISDQLSPIEVDPNQLEMSLLNLGLNSRDAMPDGGTIRIAARNVALDDETDELHGQFVALSIGDTGAGIAPENLSRIFEPFFTTKRYGEGTGLGLSRVYGFARQSNGTIKVESEPGTGTTATIYLPIAKTTGRPADGETASTAPIILVVEDDPVVADITQQLVIELGYRVFIASNAREALDLIAKQKVDAVFSDIVMPGGMSGLELARAIREREPELPVLLTSGFSETYTNVREFPFLAKPFRLEELSLTMSKLLPAAFA